jgi:alanyl-tRNA synthetase
MHDKLAHTAEHAFIGSLQNLLGRTLKVKKVEHKGSSNTAIIEIPELSLDTIFKAEMEVNRLITEGRKVISYKFPSLEEARKEIPNLRANEERISGEVRIVEIENHDIAACTMPHADDLRECDFFLVTRVSKTGNKYEVDFLASHYAKDTSVTLSTKLLKMCQQLGANINTIEETVRKLRIENEVYKVILKEHTSDKLDQIVPIINDKAILLKGIFTNLSDERLQEFVGEKIANANTVVVLANNIVTNEASHIVIARSQNMTNIDCIKLFRQFVGPDGKGGGKPHFVTGIAKRRMTNSIIHNVSSEILRLTNNILKDT